MPNLFNHTDLDDSGYVNSEFENVYNELEIKNEPYSQLYLDDTAVVVLASASGSYYPITGMSLGLNSTSNFIVQSTGNLTFSAKSHGVYFVSLNTGYKANKSCTAHVACFVNGVKKTTTSMEQGISASTANYIANSSSSGIIELEKDDILTVNIGSSDTAAVTFTVNHLQLSVFRLSKLQ